MAQGKFMKGHKINLGRTPWNKGLKTGLIPRSAFKKGHIPFNKKEGINSDGYRVKYINNSFVLEHRYIWIKSNQMPIPQGCVIHHLDKDKLNNDITNLQLLPSGVHTYLHNKLAGGSLRYGNNNRCIC